ncbi:MAG: phosphotransferase [Rhodobacter sp.]|nr:phosphotransferase [Rhodobacter sp.]
MISEGVVTAEEAVTSGVMVQDVGRSHQMYSVSVGGVPRAYLKSFGPSRGASDGSAAKERAVAALAAERPAVAALVPRHLPWRGPQAVVVTEAQPGRAAWADEADGGEQGALWSDLVRRIAKPLADFHRATRDLAAPGARPPPALAAKPPWVLALASGDAAPEIWQTQHITRATGRISADPWLCQGLRAARGIWRDMCLIHADLKHDNVLLLDRDGVSGVVIIDWEMARVGDPAWDIAALAVRLPMTALGEDPWSERTIERTAELLSAYTEVSRLPAPAVAKRLPAYMAAWLVMSAIQHQSTQAPDTSDDGASELLDKAALGFSRREQITRSLIRAVS